jgi:hypothetical protein
LCSVRVNLLAGSHRTFRRQTSDRVVNVVT